MTIAKKPAHKKPVVRKRVAAKLQIQTAVQPIAVEEAKPHVPKIAPGKHFHAVGRRKTAVTQVLLSGGNGTITVNELPFEKYFATEDLRVIVQQPLNAVGILKSINVRSKIHGGGIHAQAESMRHAIARAIIAMNPESRRLLKKHGFLTRDPRVKERKKPGLKRARRAPQFSKR